MARTKQPKTNEFGEVWDPVTETYQFPHLLEAAAKVNEPEPNVWYAVVAEDGGALISTGTVVADPLPAGYRAIEIDGPPLVGFVWDPETLAFVPIPTDESEAT